MRGECCKLCVGVQGVLGYVCACARAASCVVRASCEVRELQGEMFCKVRFSEREDAIA
jgi:hypothetical protein